MFQCAEKKCPCIIFALYLALAVMGFFTFAEALCFDEWNSWQGSGGIITSLDHLVDCLVTGPSITGKARFSASSAPRMVAPAGRYNAGYCIAVLSLQAAGTGKIAIIKNDIRLKLRI